MTICEDEPFDRFDEREELFDMSQGLEDDDDCCDDCSTCDDLSCPKSIIAQSVLISYHKRLYEKIPEYHRWAFGMNSSNS